VRTPIEQLSRAVGGPIGLPSQGGTYWQVDVTQSSDSPLTESSGIERLFVTVGTDYHRFDRMVWWLDEWLAAKPEVNSVIVQRGTSAQSEHAESIDYLQRTQLIDEFQQASVVVCHGGPATILECRSNGIVPIVVPREERFDEHVNDHQVDFCERLAAHGEIQMARTKDEFIRLLDLAVERGAPEVAVDDGHSAKSLANFEDSMVDLLGPRAQVRADGLAPVVPIREELKKIPVLFVGSVPRSGSTIMSDLLNENPHMVNIGELLQKRADRTRHIPALLVPKVSRLLATSTVQYGAVVSRILRAILEVSGKPVIVDTSKHVSTALLLRQLPDIDLRILHLVRDPRGVANSWSKVVKRPEVQGEDRPMDTLHPGRIGLRWLWFNWAFSNMDRLGVPTSTVRYEDFVADPAQTIDQIFEFAGVDAIGDQLFNSGEPLILGEGHSVSGNPRRLDRRPIELRADEQWRTDLDPKMRDLVGKVTRPMLDRYHYSKDA